LPKLAIFGRAGLLGRGRWLALVAAVALVAAIPVPYRIACPCIVEPVVRRYVAAPFTGIFEKSLVKPGDLVTRDQVLGRMDGREVRWELASLEADHSRARKLRDSDLATNKVAAAQMDRLEMERLEQKRRVLDHRAERLEIRSPIDGVVIDGDLERSEGVPVTMGDSLYEVAPLSKLVAELSVPDEDIALVEAGEEVEIQLDAFPWQSWTTRLERLQPRAEIRDERNVFLALAPLADEGQELRPGMKGTARVVGPRRSLGWIVLHKPWNRLLDWLGW
jgi:multidrug resistance efflux pump